MTTATSWDRRKDALTPYWVDQFGVLKEMDRERRPSEDHHPLVWGDRPLSKDTLKELWIQAEGKPLAFARLIEKLHGIRLYELEVRAE